jgi:hypothetical protein
MLCIQRITNALYTVFKCAEYNLNIPHHRENQKTTSHNSNVIHRCHPRDDTDVRATRILKQPSCPINMGNNERKDVRIRK